MFDIASLHEIKILKENERQRIVLCENSEGKLCLKREISGDKREIYKALQKIEHPNIPRIYYVGLADKTVVVEEYIEGESLNDLMEQNIKINKGKIRSISKQVLSALEKLHSEKIIHRDVKPDNIIIDKSNRVWLIDYDIARIYREEVRKDTESLGTFGYAPIEQYGILPTDFKTDIYAFGATLKTLLDYSKIKGFLYKIADKCKRLDPAERYESAKKIKHVLLLHSLVPVVLWVVVLVLIFAFAIHNLSNETEPVQASFEGTFSGFRDGPNEAQYRDYYNYSNACIFSMQSPWEHLIFIDDVNKTGKLKLGKNDTIIDADFTLNNGILSVTLNDDNGNTFYHKFQFDNQYQYTKNYTGNIRKNSDIICYDFNGDKATELLIGLSEGSMGAVGKQFYNNVNYCIAWCITYDENAGFKLCDGNMFSKGYSFLINESVRKLNVAWENIGDVAGYMLEGDKIVST